MINHKTFSATHELERLDADYDVALDALVDLFDAFDLNFDCIDVCESFDDMADVLSFVLRMARRSGGIKRALDAIDDVSCMFGRIHHQIGSMDDETMWLERIIDIRAALQAVENARFEYYTARAKATVSQFSA